MTSAFITGGSGFVGRTLIPMLIEKGWRVKALARSDSAAKIVANLGAEVVRGDLDDETILRDGMAGCEVVFHSAAKVEDWGDPRDFHRINVEGTERMLRAAKAAGIKRFVHVSTEAVLAGERPIINADETWPYPAHPVGLYPTTKGAAERLVRAANSAEMATVCLRPRLIWGKGDTSLLPQIIAAVQRGAFRWFGGGRYKTSTCHVRNVCEGLILGAEKGRGGEVYFLTDGAPVEFRTFMTEVLQTQGVDAGDNNLPHAVGQFVANAGEWAWRTFGLKGAPPLTRAAIRLIGEEVTLDDSKARRELGYVGKFTREQGLAEMRAAKQNR